MLNPELFTFEELTPDDVKGLPLKLQCCFFIQPWNKPFNPKSIDEWAKELGWIKFDNREEANKYGSIKQAEFEAHSLHEFVVDLITRNTSSLYHELELTIDFLTKRVSELTLFIDQLDCTATTVQISSEEKSKHCEHCYLIHERSLYEFRIRAIREVFGPPKK